MPALQFTHACKHAFTHMQLKYFSEASVCSVFVLFPFEGRRWCFSSHVLGSDLRSEACQRFFREGLTISFTKILTDEAVSGWKYEIHVSPLIPLCCCFINHHSFCLCWEASCKWLLSINSWGGGGGNILPLAKMVYKKVLKNWGAWVVFLFPLKFVAFHQGFALI